MKIRKSILLGVFATALFLGTMVFRTHPPRPVEPASNVPAPVEAAVLSPANEALPSPAYSGTALVADAKPTASVPPNGAVVDMPEVARLPANALRVPADLALAQINGQNIHLKDLVPLEAQESEQAMTLDEYASRLNRAIELELTFAAAAAQGVGLTVEQSQRLGRIAQKHEATFQGYRKEGITWSSLTAGQLDFEQRLTAGLMLQQNLVAREAGVAPSPDARVQAHYEQVLRAMLDRLKASGNITLTSAEL